MTFDAPPTQKTPDLVFAGRYALTGPIGHGAMGEVDRAYDNELRRAVAIKRLLPSRNGPSEARRARLMREARAVAQLNHPNVVAVYDVGESEGVGFIVMELVLGGSLDERMKSGERWSLAQALDWLSEICGALDAAHRAGLVHRDVKPANLLLTLESHIKVADFGVVKELDRYVGGEAPTFSAQAPLTAAGQIVGTLRYMSPEQLRGADVDGRSDQYAWGVLAYELLGGLHPYDATDSPVSNQFVADGAFIPASLVGRVPEISRELERVVLRALASGADGRFADMNEVKAALDAARHSLPGPTTVLVPPFAYAGGRIGGGATLPLANSPTVQLPSAPVLPAPKRKRSRALTAVVACVGGLALVGAAASARLLYARNHGAPPGSSSAATPLASSTLATAPTAKPATLCGPDGEVSAMVVSGGVIYFAGSFTTISCPSGSGLLLDPVTGAKPSAAAWPAVSGSVNVAVADPANVGGYYIGGDFTRVGAFAVEGIARILPDGNVDTTFAPKADGAVNALAVAEGTLYVGGQFHNINGSRRRYLAAIETATGKMTGFDPQPSFLVHALAIAGSTLYVGGSFDTIGGEARKGLAALDTSTSRATKWRPAADGDVEGLLVSGNTLYAVGGFHRVSGKARNGLASWTRSTGSLTSFDAHADDQVDTLAISGNTLYVGGAFKTVGGQKRTSLAALDASTGKATTWEAAPIDYRVKTVAASSSTVYVGGRFTTVGGQERHRLAAFDATTGTTTAFDPSPSDVVATIAISGQTLYVGGDFTGVGGETRRNVAALDAATGKVTAWNANLSDRGHAYALVVSGDTLYVGGTIRQGDSRDIIALDIKTAAVKDWHPPKIGGGSVRALAVAGNVLYAGGWFKTVGTLPRNSLAAIDTTTGAPLPWDPKVVVDSGPAEGIEALVLSKNTLYVAGGITAIGDKPRRKMGAIDLTTAEATGFDPRPDESVVALSVLGDTVYAAGRFEEIGGQRRKHLAALDGASGSATATHLDAMVPGICYSMAIAGDVLYAGCRGDSGILAFDTKAASYLAFNPHIGGHVRVIAVDGGHAYAGGEFRLAGGLPRGNLAVLDATSAVVY